MILPRPIPTVIDAKTLQSWMAEKLEINESFRLCDQLLAIRFYRFKDWEDEIAICGIGDNSKRVAKIGLIRLYASIEKDIGLFFFNNDGVKMPAMSWLMSGIDGTKNLDRLAKALAVNGEILPKMGTKEGKILSDILKESNEAIDPGDKDNIQTIEHIDYALTRYNIYLDVLITNSGLVSK